jgi:hypothetical protein
MVHGVVKSAMSSSLNRARSWPSYAAELAYDLTVIQDATADYSDVEMSAALEVNIPTTLA